MVKNKLDQCLHRKGTCIPFNTERILNGKLFVTDLTGKIVQTIYKGDFKIGNTNFFINTHEWTSGAYIIVLESNEGTVIQKLMVK